MFRGNQNGEKVHRKQDNDPKLSVLESQSNISEETWQFQLNLKVFTF